MPGDAVVTFDDNDTAGMVTLTMDLTDWVGGDGADTAYAFEWFFSLVDFSADDLNFTHDSGQLAVGGIINPAANFDGQGNFFPFSIEFEQSNNANRFTAGETSVYLIDDMGLDLLTVNNFFDASNVPDDWQAGLRARGLNGTFDKDGEGSGWFTGGTGGQIPEPTSFVIWGMLGFTGVAMSSRRRRKH